MVWDFLLLVVISHVCCIEFYFLIEMLLWLLYGAPGSLVLGAVNHKSIFELCMGVWRNDRTNMGDDSLKQVFRKLLCLYLFWSHICMFMESQLERTLGLYSSIIQIKNFFWLSQNKKRKKSVLFCYHILVIFYCFVKVDMVVNRCIL